MVCTLNENGTPFLASPPCFQSPVSVQSRSYRPYRTSDEYLYAIKEDLTEWFNVMYGMSMCAHDLLEHLENGVLLCQHANNVQKHLLAYKSNSQKLVLDNYSTVQPPSVLSRSTSEGSYALNHYHIPYKMAIQAGSFFARDNVHNFISWCRHQLGIIDCLLFETEDLVTHKNEKNVLLCLLEVARQGGRYGVRVPLLVQLERDIDMELKRHNETAGMRHRNWLSSSTGPSRNSGEGHTSAGMTTKDLRSLHEMVRDIVGRCTCVAQYPVVRVADGRYQVGESKTLIFVRILRNHVMVRVGGGWDTLEHYLYRHDPCRSVAGHGPDVIEASLHFHTQPQTHSYPRVDVFDSCTRDCDISLDLSLAVDKLNIEDSDDDDEGYRSQARPGSETAIISTETTRSPTTNNVSPPHTGTHPSLAHVTTKQTPRHRGGHCSDGVGGNRATVCGSNPRTTVVSCPDAISNVRSCNQRLLRSRGAQRFSPLQSERVSMAQSRRDVAPTPLGPTASRSDINKSSPCNQMAQQYFPDMNRTPSSGNYNNRKVKVSAPILRSYKSEPRGYQARLPALSAASVCREHVRPTKHSRSSSVGHSSVREQRRGGRRSVRSRDVSYDRHRCNLSTGVDESSINASSIPVRIK